MMDVNIGSADIYVCTTCTCGFSTQFLAVCTDVVRIYLYATDVKWIVLCKDKDLPDTINIFLDDH